MGKPLVVGNWKMELSHKAALEVARALRTQLKNTKAEIVICPSYPSLEGVKKIIAKSTYLSLGAQNVFGEERGAFTSQVSVVQLQEFVDWCLVGHSEVRAATNESEESIGAKAQLLIKHRITPIVCIGETAQEREADRTVEKITMQVASLLHGVDRGTLSRLVIAYEPIWAIGTGITPESNEVAEVVLLIRKLVTNTFDQRTADHLRILYGGSVKPDNVSNYVGGPSADGVLVGGASVHPGDFAKIAGIVESVSD